MFGKRPKDQPEPPGHTPAVPGPDGPAAGEAKAHKRPLMATLEVGSGPNKGTSIPLTRIVTIIGRSENCDIILADQSVSREHGQIEQHQNEWIYTNLSENGTWINRKKADRIVLRSGDLIEVGAETKLKFLLKEEEKVELGPVVRRRSRQSHREAEEMIVVEASPQEKAEAAKAFGGALLKRKKLLIGIGIYFVIIVIAVAVLSPSPGDKKPGGSRGGAVISGEFNEQQLKSYLDLRFSYTPNAARAAQKLHDAQVFYDQRNVGNDPMALYNAVRDFQESMAYGAGYLKEQRFNQLYKDARDELAKQLWDLYRFAQIEEAKGHPVEARKFYKDIMRRVPSDNPIYTVVDGRNRRLRSAPGK